MEDVGRLSEYISPEEVGHLFQSSIKIIDCDIADFIIVSRDHNLKHPELTMIF